MIIELREYIGFSTSFMISCSAYTKMLMQINIGFNQSRTALQDCN